VAFPLDNTILLMGMRARDKMSDSNTIKEATQFLVFTSPIGQHGQDFTIKQTLNMSLKTMKFINDIRPVFKQIVPCKFAKIVDKRNIVTMMSKRRGGWTHTSENTSSRGALDMLTNLGNRSCWLLAN
jgi:hypothetical protein